MKGKTGKKFLSIFLTVLLSVSILATSVVYAGSEEEIAAGTPEATEEILAESPKEIEEELYAPEEIPEEKISEEIAEEISGGFVSGPLLAPPAPEPHTFYVGKNGVSGKAMFDDLKTFADYKDSFDGDIKYSTNNGMTKWNQTFEGTISDESGDIKINAGTYFAYTKVKDRSRDTDSAKLMGSFTVIDNRDETSITAENASLNFYTQPSKEDVFYAVVTAVSHDDVITSDSEDVTIQYYNGRNWVNMEGSSDFCVDRASEQIKVIYAGSDELKSCSSAEVTLSDSRPDPDFEIKEPIDEVTLYAGAPIISLDYESVFNAIISTSSLPFNKGDFDILFESEYKYWAIYKYLSASEWVSLDDYHHSSDPTQILETDGKKINEDNGESTKSIKIEFKGNAEYRPKSFGQYRLVVNVIEDPRTDSSLALNSGEYEVTLYDGMDIVDSVYEAVFSQAIDGANSVPENPTFNKDKFDILFSSYSSLYDKSEWVSLNDYYHGITAWGNGKKFGKNDTESVKITYYGNETYKPYTTDAFSVKINHVTPKIHLSDMDLSLYSVKNLNVPAELSKVQNTIINAVDDTSPSDFLTGAKVTYKYFCLGADSYSTLGYLDLNWVELGEKPVIGGITHEFGTQKSDKSISDDIEAGNFDYVRITCTNDRYPGIKLSAEAKAMVEDTRAITKFAEIAPITISYSPENEAADILAAIEEQYPMLGLVLLDEEDSFVPFSYDNGDISVELEAAIPAGDSQEVTVRYKGTDAEYRPCETTVSVTVKKAKATIDVQQENVVYDGKTHDPRISTTPNDDVDYVTVIVGVDGDAKGFVSIDFPKSLQERLDILNSGLIPERFKDAVKEILDGLRIPHNLYTYIKGQIGDGTDISGIKDILSSIINILNREVPLSGKTIGELIGLNSEMINQIAAILDNIPSIGGLTITLGAGPKNAGLYDVTAFTVDSNYTFDIDTDIFVIGQQTKGLKLEFDEEMPKNILGLYEMSPVQAEKFDYSVSLLKDGEKKEIDQSHVKVVYYGVESDVEIELGTTPPTEPGIYRQTAFVFGGNYFASPVSRTFIIDRYDVKIELIDDTVTYDGYPHTLDVNVFIESEDGYVKPDAETEQLIKDSIDYIYTKGLNVSLDAPVDAGTYTVTAYLALSSKFNPAVDTGKLVINKASVSITITMEGDEVVYDNRQHGLEATAIAKDGKDLSDDVVITYRNNRYNSTRKPVNAGTYTVTATYRGSKNYEEATATATLVILKRDVTITLFDKQVTYGEIINKYFNPQGLEYVVDGMATGDSLFVFPDVVKTDEYPEVGEYTITAFYRIGNWKNENYNVTIKDATLDILPLDITVTIESKWKYYTDEDPELTYVLDKDLPYRSDVLNVVLERYPGEDVGIYAILGSVEPENKNFKVHFVNDLDKEAAPEEEEAPVLLLAVALDEGEPSVSLEPEDETGIFEIIEMPITITIDAKEKFVGDKDPELTATVTDIHGDKVDPKDINLKLTRKPGEEAGTYEITAEFESDSYILDKVNKASLTIKKSPVTGDANHMGLWLVITILAALILAFNLVLVRRKHSK